MSFFKKLAILILSLQIVMLPYLNTYAAVSDVVTPPPSNYKPLPGPNYPIDKGEYFTDDFGNVLMVINVLGRVAKPGQIIVRDDVDFAELLSLVGDVREDANLKKIIVARYKSDGNASEIFKINLKKFINEGDRSDFIALKPDDTIIFPAKSGLTLASIAQMSSIIFSSLSYYTFLRAL